MSNPPPVYGLPYRKLYDIDAVLSLLINLCIASLLFWL